MRRAWRIAVLAALAMRTHETVRPAHGNERSVALIVRAISPVELDQAQPLLELHRIARHCRLLRASRLSLYGNALVYFGGNVEGNQLFLSLEIACALSHSNSVRRVSCAKTIASSPADFSHDVG